VELFPFREPGLKVDKWSSTMAPLAPRDHPVNRRRLKLHCVLTVVDDCIRECLASD
jgi:hypothetical protein